MQGVQGGKGKRDTERRTNGKEESGRGREKRRDGAMKRGKDRKKA